MAKVDMTKVDARLAALRAERQKTGRLDANESYEYAKCLQLKQQQQKQQLDDKIQQEMFAKKNGAPTPQKGEVAAKPAEADTSFHITGLAIEKGPDKTES